MIYIACNYLQCSLQTSANATATRIRGTCGKGGLPGLCKHDLASAVIEFIELKERTLLFSQSVLEVCPPLFPSRLIAHLYFGLTGSLDTPSRQERA